MGRREDERIRDADWAAEQAARAMLDSAWDYAIIWSDRAVDGTHRIYRKNRTEERVVDIFAGRLWDRALIHQALGNVSEGIRDATEALTLFEELAAAYGTQYELRIPSVRLLLCELSAVAGDPEAARRFGQAIEAYRERLVEPSLLIADAFARYGTAMRVIGDPAAAPAFRQAVDVYRMPEVDVTDQSIVRRFVHTAIQVATDAEPATATVALEILPILQDAAERTVRLVPEVYPMVATPENNADMRTPSPSSTWRVPGCWRWGRPGWRSTTPTSPMPWCTTSPGAGRTRSPPPAGCSTRRCGVAVIHPRFPDSRRVGGRPLAGRTETRNGVLSPAENAVSSSQVGFFEPHQAAGQRGQGNGSSSWFPPSCPGTCSPCPGDCSCPGDWSWPPCSGCTGCWALPPSVPRVACVVRVRPSRTYVNSTLTPGR
ncbi:tetratricopeptide repeat protein [Actinopolymorpha pittospori]|uniref:tetratricopeptide repeat protein n=1 Tax=Actinopolymorpha pittospori TaxID=648752 RepID=UPI0031ED2638